VRVVQVTVTDPGRSRSPVGDDVRPGREAAAATLVQQYAQDDGASTRGAATTRWTAVSLRVGLVGAGGVGARHARTLAGLTDVDLIGICDPEPAAREALAGELDVPPVADLDTLLRSRPDAVWLCVPPFAHGEPELAVLRAGLPFFVEKPLAADLPTAERVAAAVAEAGVPTATGYHWRHLDTVAGAQEALGDRQVRLVDARWWGTTPPPAWWSRADRSGGQVVEQATHVLDLVRLLAGEVAEVTGGAAPSSREGRDVPDATAAVLRFTSGAVGTVSTSCVLPALTAAGLEVVTDGLAVQLTETALQVRTPAGESRTEPVVDARLAVDRAFVDVLAGAPAAPGLVDVGEALRTHRLAWAIAEATRTGAPVRPGER
jgi:myo-inositol 2-dehydrogenase / D-chiro-inositol 1-dehydrogenase